MTTASLVIAIVSACIALGSVFVSIKSVAYVRRQAHADEALSRRDREPQLVVTPEPVGLQDDKLLFTVRN